MASKGKTESRRTFIRYAAVFVIGAAIIGGGIATYYASLPPVVKVVEKPVEKIVEKPVEKVVKETVKETVTVAGSPSIVEKVVEKVVTVTPTPAAPPVVAKAYDLRGLGGWVLATYYPVMGGLSRVLYAFTSEEKPPAIRLYVQSSGASVANIRLMSKGAADIGLIQNDQAYYAWHGTRMFEGAQVRNLRTVVCIYPEAFHLVVRKDSGIKRFEDIKGKIISIGPIGSGTTENMLEVMEVYGLTTKDLAKAERLSDTEAVDYFKDGRIHGVVVVSGIGVAMVKELAEITGADIIEIPKDMREKIKEKFPFFVDVVLPAGTYKGVPEMPTLAVKAVMVCRDDIPDEAVYTILKVLMSEDGLKQFYLSHGAAKYLTRKTALEGISTPLHPGAEKFYKEVGIPIPPLPKL